MVLGINSAEDQSHRECGEIAQEKPKNRILYLDGLRGLSILFVLQFHAYARWTSIVPYGSRFSDFPLFKFGSLGVFLFFLISGFVISMTLEKCRNFVDFIYRRWIRLFPAMLICTIIIFCSAGFFKERPAGIPNISSTLPGLLFIDPGWLSRIFHVQIIPIEGAFWSLFVEFKFYVFAAIIYFYVSKKYFFHYVMSLFLCALLVHLFFQLSPNHFWAISNMITTNFSLQHFGWFASGSAFYEFSTTKKPKYFLNACIAGLISAIALSASSSGVLPNVATISVFLLFALAIANINFQNLLQTRFILFLGIVSYPLYLFHENMMISMIIKIGKHLPRLPGLLVPIAPVILLSLLAYFIARYAEPKIKYSINAFRFISAKSRS